MDQKQNIISVKNFSVSFDNGAFKAIDNITFTIAKGKTLGLVGESGSGKSLTSLSLIGLLPKNAETNNGQLIFKQHEKQFDLNQISESEFRSLRGSAISMIFQEPMTSLNPTITCGQQVAEIIHQHTHLSTSEIKNRVLELFEEVKLPRPDKIFKSYPHQISGGQKQRVMIAMAIACNPQLLIADEPTTALDVTVQKEILKLLKEIQAKHQISILFITHDLDVVNEIADEIIVMHKGHIVEKGIIQNVLKNPSHPYTKGLLASKPPIDKRPVSLQTVELFLKGDVFINETLISKEERQVLHSRIYAQEPVLKVKDLITAFPLKKSIFGKVTQELKAVNQVSFDLHKGETLGLVGESGCGKTTLGRTLLQLEKASAGEILYQGENILNFNRKQMLAFRKKFQIIFQDPYSSLNPKLTVGATIMEVMEVHKILSSKKERLDRTLELLKKVGLEEKHFNHYPHEFSGGQRQRIGIARALALEPEFIICDESVSALDVSVQAQVLNLLNELKKEFNLSYIFISHNLSVVRFMSDRIIVMNKGEIEEIGEADQLYQNPQKAYTQTLIDSIPGHKPNKSTTSGQTHEASS